MTITFSRHAEIRANQRSYNRLDAEVIRELGRPIIDRNGEVYLLSDKDADAQIAQRKREIHQIERLRGSKAVFDGDCVRTVTHNTPKHMKRLLRRNRG